MHYVDARINILFMYKFVTRISWFTMLLCLISIHCWSAWWLFLIDIACKFFDMHLFTSGQHWFTWWSIYISIQLINIHLLTLEQHRFAWRPTSPYTCSTLINMHLLTTYQHWSTWWSIWISLHIIIIDLPGDQHLLTPDQHYFAWL